MAFFAADDTRVVLHFEHQAVADAVLFHQFFFTLLRIHIHTAEFVNLEFSSVLSYPVLGEENRSRGFDIDRRGDKQEDDSCQDASYQAAADIHDSFQNKFTGACHVDACSDNGVITHTLYDLVFALHFVDICNFHMNRDSHFCECIKNFLWDLSAFRQNDQHFVKPLAADILGCVCEAGNDWHAVDFASGSVLIYEDNAGRADTDIIEVKHAFYNRL